MLLSPQKVNDTMFFSFSEYLLVNQWIQGLVPISTLSSWFEVSTDRRKADILEHLVELCEQARAKPEDGISAIRNSGLNPRRSAGVILSRGATRAAFRTLEKLKKADGNDAFVLLLHLLRVADIRRKAGESPGTCKHWWHLDLGNPEVVKELRQTHEKRQIYSPT